MDQSRMTRPRRDRFRLISAACLLLVAMLALWFARDTAFNYDEFYFLDAAKTLALTGKYATVANARPYVFDPYLSTGPTVIGPIALAFWLWRPGYFVARLFMVAFFVALFVLLYRVASELYGRAAGLLACVFVLCVPLVWFMGLHVLGEIPAAVLFLAGAHCLLRAERSRSRIRACLLAGLFLGLAALTKLIFFLGVVALGGLALVVAARDRRRAAALAGGVVVALAVLGGWELVQFLAIGAESYRELKQDFYHMFAQESGMKAWLGRGPSDLLGDTLGTWRSNLRAIGDAGWGVPLTVLVLIVVVFAELGRTIAARRHTAVHVFLGLFLGSYAAWFFFAKHEPFYRLFLPAYLLSGLYVGGAFAETAVTLTRPMDVRRKLLLGVTAGTVAVLLIVPFFRNGADLVATYRDQPAWRNLRLIAILREQVPADAKIGYWGWWRAPEVSFFLPNRFFDISLPEQRETFSPQRDFILATAPQKRLDPLSWEHQRRFCREEMVVQGRNTLCRFGHDVAQIPVAPSLRLDFMAKGALREDQLSDGFYRTPEPPPRWIASPARFFIGTAGKEGRLHLTFDVPSHLGPTEPNPVTLAVTVNGAVLTRLQFTTAGPKSVTTDCIAPDPATDVARVELTTDRSFVPHQLGLNRDTRVLSLQLRDVEFHPDAQCRAPRR